MAVNVEFDTAPHRNIVRRGAETIDYVHRVTNRPIGLIGYPNVKVLKSMLKDVRKATSGFLMESSRFSRQDSFSIVSEDPSKAVYGGYDDILEILGEISKINHMISQLDRRMQRGHRRNVRYVMFFNRSYIKDMYVTSRKRKWESY